MLARSEHITIHADEEHDPPRWLAVDGLRYFDQGRWLGGAWGLAISVVLVGGSIVATRSNPNSVPLWAIGLGIGVVLMAAFAGMMLGLRHQKNADIRELSKRTHNGHRVHARALLAGVYNIDRSRSASNRVFDAEDFVEAYQPSSAAHPLAIITGPYRPENTPAPADHPQHIKGEPPISAHDSKLLIALAYLPIAFVLVMLIRTFLSMNPTLSHWLMFAPVILLIAAQPLICEFEIRLIFPRRSAIIERGRIEYRKRFRRHTLRASEAVCFITVGKRKTSVVWHRRASGSPR